MTLSSGAEAGLVVKPFRGIRYAPDRVGDIAGVTSPPYDVIGSGALASLRGASEYNSVQLILPGPDDPVEAGALAADRLGGWLRSGVLVRDERPGLYFYEQNGSSGLQRGIIALVRVGPPSSSGIFPHEAVMPGPVAGRRALMEATRANLEPIFLVYNGRGGLGGEEPPKSLVDAGGCRGGLGGIVPPGKTLVSTTTDDGETHRLSAVTGPAADDIAADLSRRTALIADGHHRFAAYRELSDSMHAAGHGAGPWDYGLAFLVDADAFPPRLGAIHRVIPRLPAAEAARRASAGFTVRELTGGFEASLAALDDAGADGGTAFVLAGPDGHWLLTRPDLARATAAMPDGTSPRWRSLDAAVLQGLLLADLWGISDNEHDVLISHDAAEAVRMARAGSPGSPGSPGSATGTAVLCNPVPFEAVRDVAAGGECVPRKSTSFGPKPRTGLVFRTFVD